MHEQGTPTSIEDALLWLNDRLGKNVAAWIEVEQGDSGNSLLEAAGELRHWSEGAKPSLLLLGGKRPRDDLAGLYKIGDGATIDLTDVRPLEVGTPVEPSHLIVRLDKRTTLEIVEQEELPEDGD